MRETAIVQKVESERIVVECQASSDCQGCSRCSVGAGTRTMEAVNRSGEPLRTGDVVEVYLAPAKAIGASFMVLILPLLLFIACYYIGGEVLPAAGDPLKVLLGFTGIGIGFAVNLLLKRGRRDLPEIVRKHRMGETMES